MNNEPIFLYNNCIKCTKLQRNPNTAMPIISTDVLQALLTFVNNVQNVSRRNALKKLMAEFLVKLTPCLSWY